MRRISADMPGSVGIQRESPTQSAASSRTPGGSTTCSATSGSGAPPHTPSHMTEASRKEQTLIPAFGFCGAARGTTLASTAALPAGKRSSPSSAPAAAGSEWFVPRGILNSPLPFCPLPLSSLRRPAEDGPRFSTPPEGFTPSGGYATETSAVRRAVSLLGISASAGSTVRGYPVSETQRWGVLSLPRGSACKVFSLVPKLRLGTRKRGW